MNKAIINAKHVALPKIFYHVNCNATFHYFKAKFFVILRGYEECFVPLRAVYADA
jgi:hypothetical protein